MLLNWINSRIENIFKTPEMWGQSLEALELQLLLLFEMRSVIFEKEFTSSDYFKIVEIKYKKYGTICSILEHNFSRLREFIFVIKIINDELLKNLTQTK